MKIPSLLLAITIGVLVRSGSAASTPTNAFGIYLFAEHLDGWHDSAKDWATRALSPMPVISEADIIEYRFTNHVMTLTPEAAQRMTTFRIQRLVQPFVVATKGERIYQGAFVSAACSKSIASPSITLWGANQFTIYTNLPPNSLFIERTYHAPFSAAQPDPRSDERIRRALEGLRKLK